jgi:hypothetical protein
MTPAELAARRYIDAWLEPDRDARRALIEACVAPDIRIVVRGRTLHGRAALMDEMNTFFTDPRQLTTKLTSVIDASGDVFRFRALAHYADGKPFVELLDVGEVNADGKIAVLYTFIEPLAAAP